MGVTFIGNPFQEQETEYDDSDWEMNTADEWIMPPQEIAFIDDVGRATIDLILAPGDESSGEDTDANWAESNEDEESDDEDYNPEEDDANYDLDYENQDFNSYFFDSDEDDEDIDYVTYPLSDEHTSDPEKPTSTDTPNPGETSDTD